MPIITNDSDKIPRLLLTDSSGRLVTLLSDGTTTATIDADTSSIKTIDISHHEVHEGDFFHLDHLFGAVADAATADVYMRVGATKNLHVTFRVAAAGLCNVYLYEATTVTANGTPNYGTGITPVDKNRQTANTATGNYYHTPTVDAVGTVLDQDVIFGSTRPQSIIGGEVRTGSEWILKKGVHYMLRVTNGSGGALDILSVIEFYEV